MSKSKKFLKQETKKMLKTEAELAAKAEKRQALNQSKDLIDLPDGKVVDILPGERFKVLVGGQIIECKLCGKMYKNNIRVVRGDIVDVQTSVYNMSIGRIMVRH